MRRRFAVFVLPAVLAGFPLTVAGPASATSCAAHEDASPAAVLAGTDRLSTGGHFLDDYPAAAVVTVVAVRTDAREGSPTYGATEIDVAVAAAFGERAADVGPLVTLRAADPGWMNGPFWDVGASYFVPLFAIGPGGEEHWTFVCDPITQVDDAKESAEELTPLAGAAGVAVVVPGDGGPSADRAGAPEARPAGSTSDEPGDGLPVGAVGGAAALAGLATGARLLRRRSPTPARPG